MRTTPSDPHPEAGIFRGQTTQNFGPKYCRDMVTGVTGEIRHCRDMLTGVIEETHDGPYNIPSKSLRALRIIKILQKYK